VFEQELISRCALAGQPHLKIIGLARAKAHVAGAQQQLAIGQVQAFEDGFGGADHALVFGLDSSGRTMLTSSHFSNWCWRMNRAYRAPPRPPLSGSTG
jgi:hypothetical protein